MLQQDLSQSFQNVENTQTDIVVKFLEEGNNIPSVRECFQEQLNWLNIQPGQQILDVGCGIGDQAMELATYVGNTGKVIGTDLSEVMIQVAKQRHLASEKPLDFLTAEATEQPFPNASFDVVRTERVLMFVPDVQRAFQEFSRLLKPKGKLLVFDFDWDALTIAHHNKSLTRRIVSFISDNYPNGRIGARLFSCFKSSGFENIKIKAIGYLSSLEFARRAFGGAITTALQKGLFAEEDIEQWWAYLESENQQGRFFTSFNGFLTMGTKLD